MSVWKYSRCFCGYIRISVRCYIYSECYRSYTVGVDVFLVSSQYVGVVLIKNQNIVPFEKDYYGFTEK